jgi:hypothetical protein
MPGKIASFGVEARVRKALMAVIAAAMVAGCADGQGAYVNAASGHFSPGVTTRAQAVAQLGPPSSIYDLADGSRTVTWARDGGLFAPSDTRSLSIQFGPDDRMIRIVSGTAPGQ